MASSPGEGDQGSAIIQILQVGAALLKNFIYERLRRHGDSNAVVIREQLDVQEPTDPRIKEISDCLQQIGDRVDAEIKRMIDIQTLVPSSDMFLSVAREIFSDGKFNWGRVVALFCFACQLVVKALITNLPDFITTIISWTMDYLRENVVNWIRDQGGWAGVRAYFGTPTWQFFAVLLAGAVTAVLVSRKM